MSLFIEKWIVALKKYDITFKDLVGHVSPFCRIRFTHPEYLLDRNTINIVAGNNIFSFKFFE